MKHNSNILLINALLFLEKCKIISPKQVSLAKYFLKFGKRANLKNPQNLNEKIMQLMFCSDTMRWTELADKYRVRDYVKQCGLQHLLPTLYGVYCSADEIDFEQLPNSFVLKTNNACGAVILVDDKSKLNITQTRKTLDKWLKTPFGVTSAEPHYRLIKPCVIAEEYLKEETPNPISSSLIDYKIWCFNGNPDSIFTGINRDVIQHKVDFDLYEAAEWKRRRNGMTDKYRNDTEIPTPLHLSDMLDYARLLSKGFPQVRIDLYEVNGKVYFGEMTFSSFGGRMPYFTDECLRAMCEKINSG